MVPTEQDAEALVCEGVSRGRIWSAAELVNLMSVADGTPDVVRTIAHSKLAMEADVVAIRRRK
jgi:hypothetical protein